MTDNALLVEPFAAILESLSLVMIDGTDLRALELAGQVPQPWRRRGTCVVVCLVAHSYAASKSLGLQQGTICATHADTVVPIEVPTARALFVGKDSSKKAEAKEKKTRNSHCNIWIETVRQVFPKTGD